MSRQAMSCEIDVRAVTCSFRPDISASLGMRSNGTFIWTQCSYRYAHDLDYADANREKNYMHVRQ